jgi:ferredoxin
MKIRLAHKKAECIGCALCTEVAGDYFVMDPNGEAILRQIVEQQGLFDYAVAYASDLDRLEVAAEGCPVNIIRLQKKLS